eukprot:scaffold117780_cov39-Phaeocystis_antarctica.AAC.1
MQVETHGKYEKLLENRVTGKVEVSTSKNMTEHNPAPSPSGHPLLSGPPTLTDIHQIFTSK